MKWMCLGIQSRWAVNVTSWYDLDHTTQIESFSNMKNMSHLVQEFIVRSNTTQQTGNFLRQIGSCEASRLMFTVH